MSRGLGDVYKRQCPKCMNMMCRPGPEKLINSVPDKVRNGCLFVKGLSVPDECPEIDFSFA